MRKPDEALSWTVPNRLREAPSLPASSVPMSARLSDVELGRWGADHPRPLGEARSGSPVLLGCAPNTLNARSTRSR